jgi:ribose transport system substrate-binding protein
MPLASRLALVSALALVAAGCSGEPPGGGKPEGRKYRIALIYKATTNPFFQTMEKGAAEKARELGVALEAQGIESESDAEAQANIVRIMLNSGVDAIIIAPASSTGIVTALLRAQEAKVPLINIDNRIDKAEAEKQGLRVATFIGPDNREGARHVGLYASDLIKKKLGPDKKGKVILLNGIEGVANAEARKAGFEAAVKEAGLQVAGSQSAEWDTAKAQTATSALVAANPDVQGILCANDKMALGAIAACEGRGLIGKIVIVGYDNIDLARQAMKQDKMQATIEQNPAMMGALGVESAVKALQGQTLPAETPVPVQLVTRDDVLKEAAK